MSVRKLASASLANLLIPATGLLVSPVLSRALGPSGRGLYAALTLPIVVYGWAGTFGLQDALSYHLRTERLNRRTAARVSLIAGAPLGAIGLGVLIILGVPIFGTGPHYLQFVTLCLLAPIHVLANLFIGALTGISDVTGVNLVKVLPAVLRTVLVIGACAAFHVDAYGVAALFLASTMAGVVVGLVRLRRGPTPVEPAPPVPVHALARYSAACLPGVLATVSSARLDQIIGLPLIGARQLGFYAAAVSVAELPMVLATAARTVLLGRPGTADERTATRAARLAVLASVLACAVLAAAAPVAVPLFFGAAFTPAVGPTVILCAGTILYTCMVLYTAALLVDDRAAWSSAALLSGSAVGVAGLFALSGLGATGAAAASVCGYAVSVAVATWALIRTSGGHRFRLLSLADREDLRICLRWVARQPVIRWLALRRPASGANATVATLLVLAWLRILVPQVIQVFVAGRPAFNARAVAVPAAATMIGNGLSLAFLVLAAGLVAGAFRRGRPHRLGTLAAIVAPLAAIVLSGLVNHDPPEIIWLALPLAATAIWAQRPDARVFAVLGVLGAISATGSVLIALVRPDIGLLSAAAAGAKQHVVGGLLAGPYPHSNVLGIVLALTLPFVFEIRHTIARRASLAAILVALLWTESRASQAAAVLVLVTYALIRRYPGRRWPVAMPLLAGLALIVLVPLVTRNPHGFSQRGRIWQVLLHRWAHAPVLGLGPGYFDREPGLARALGGQFTHAHNLMVQLLVVGGLLALVLFGFLAFLAWRSGVVALRTGHPGPLLFLIALGHVSWLEASHLATTLAGYLSWLPLFLIVGTVRPAAPGPGSAEPSTLADVPVQPPSPTPTARADQLARPGL